MGALLIIVLFMTMFIFSEYLHDKEDQIIIYLSTLQVSDLQKPWLAVSHQLEVLKVYLLCIFFTL